MSATEMVWLVNVLIWTVYNHEGLLEGGITSSALEKYLEYNY